MKIYESQTPEVVVVVAVAVVVVVAVAVAVGVVVVVAVDVVVVVVVEVEIKIAVAVAVLVVVVMAHERTIHRGQTPSDHNTDKIKVIHRKELLKSCRTTKDECLKCAAMSNRPRP